MRNSLAQAGSCQADHPHGCYAVLHSDTSLAQWQYKEIQLSNGLIAIVDPADSVQVSQKRWHAKPHGRTTYARTWDGKSMHRILMGALPGVEVDHINGCGLDNRRANLRFVTRSQNLMNTGKSRRNRSGYKGIYKNSKKTWAAAISADGVVRYLGSFQTPEKAATAYDSAALKYHGEFARINFPKSHAPRITAHASIRKARTFFRGGR